MKGLIRICCAAALALAAVPCLGWGGYEHTVIAYAAQDHLTGNALRHIRHYLDQPIYEYAEWMDYIPIQQYPGYELVKYGHCSVVWTDGTVSGKPAIEDGQGDGYGRMVEVVNTLKNHRELPDSIVVLHLRCFIHMMGDYHCPGHILFFDKPDTGNALPSAAFSANPIWEKIYWKTSTDKKSIHWLWDAALQNLHPDWTFEQWRRELDTWGPVQCASATEGSLEDWLLDNAERAREVFSLSKAGTTYDESYYTGRALEICYLQMRLAIYRLAKVLNDCFDYED